MIKNLLKKTAAGLGYEIRKAQVYDLAEEAAAAIDRVRAHTMLPHERMITLYQQAVFCERQSIPGDFVECGVWKGGSVGLMALANMRHGKIRRHIHLFDAFQEFDAQDDTVDSENAVNKPRGNTGDISMRDEIEPLKGIYDGVGGPGTLEANTELLEKMLGYDADYLHYHAGWFQDTLPVAAPGIDCIAILRLDFDAYHSIKDCLQHLYEKVASGGFVIIDDYGTYEGCRNAVDEFIAGNNIRAFLSQVDNSCRYWIKP